MYIPAGFGQPPKRRLDVGNMHFKDQESLLAKVFDSSRLAQSGTIHSMCCARVPWSRRRKMDAERADQAINSVFGCCSGCGEFLVLF